MDVKVQSALVYDGIDNQFIDKRNATVGDSGGGQKLIVQEDDLKIKRSLFLVVRFHL